MGKYSKWPNQDVSSGSQIGPHEGIELCLLREQMKPLAILQLDNTKKLSKKFVVKYFDYSGMYWIALKEEAWRIKIAERLFERREAGESLRIFHVKFGRLLGYSKNQIRAFINK